MTRMLTSCLSLLIAANLFTTQALADQQVIGTGTSANDKTGDTLRNAFIKANQNFAELFAKADSTVNPTDPQWAGGADPTGVKDSSPAIAAILSVPATGATIPAGGGGQNFVIGEVLTASPSNVALICSSYPTFRITALGANGGAALVTPVSPGLCANTTAVPPIPSSSPIPTYYTTTGGSGSGATLNISWAPRNAKIQFPCGTFLLNKSVGAIHDNTEIAGNGNCTVIKASSTISTNPNNGGLFASGNNADLLTNADFVKGNSNIHVHDLTFDSTANAGNVFQLWFVQSTNIRTDHIHYLGKDGQGSGAMFVQSDNFSIEDSTFDYFGVSSGIWQASTNWWVVNNKFYGHGTANAPMQYNGLGSNAGTYIPLGTTTSNGVIAHNYINNFRATGIDITGLCQPGKNVCGRMDDILVFGNVIDTVTQFVGIFMGGGARNKVIGNIIKNIGGQCIVEQIALAGGVNSDTDISGNTCINVNTLGGATIDAISIGDLNDIQLNTSIRDNNVLGGGYRYATAVLTSNPQRQTIVSAVVASGGSGNHPGDVLPLSGGTPVAGIPASSFTVLTVDGSGGVLTVAPTVLGAFSAIPSNPVTTTSSGSGTPPTLNVTWTNLGPSNTSFRAGIEDTGTVGFDDVLGTLKPVPAYGAWTFQTNATFSDSSIGLTVTNDDATKYAQMKFAPSGATHPYQLGVGGGSETVLGVANCNYLYDVAAAKARWRVCSDGSLNINPIAGTAAVATLDVNGTGRVAPGTLAAAGTCNAASEGKFATISDSSTSTPGATISGGGSLHVFGVCLNSLWTVH